MIYLYGIILPNKITSSEYDCMYKRVSKERQLRINQYYFDIDKKRSLFAELLLRYILDMHLAIAEYNLSFDKNKFGKPKLTDYPNIFFNCSHSGTWIICAVGGCQLGVDVEMIEERNFDIAKRFYTVQEYEDLQSKSEKDQKEYFYRLWTLKESYIKAIGKGLVMPLDSFSIHLDEIIELNINKKVDENYIFWSERLDGKHIASLCYDSSKVGELDIQLRTLSYEGLLKWLVSR